MPKLSTGLDFAGPPRENEGMKVFHGHVHNGVVVLEGEAELPEGAEVVVSYLGPTAMPTTAEKKRIQVPLVRTGQPGSVHLTGARIAEILDEEDAAPGR